MLSDAAAALPALAEVTELAAPVPVNPAPLARLHERVQAVLDAATAIETAGAELVPSEVLEVQRLGLLVAAHLTTLPTSRLDGLASTTLRLLTPVQEGERTLSPRRLARGREVVWRVGDVGAAGAAGKSNLVFINTQGEVSVEPWNNFPTPAPARYRIADVPEHIPPSSVLRLLRDRLLELERQQKMHADQQMGRRRLLAQTRAL